MLQFVSGMKCVAGLCPRDFEDYGCACRFEMEGLPVDESDRDNQQERAADTSAQRYMFSGSAEIVATAKGVTIVPAGIKSLGLAVSSVRSGPEETSGKGVGQSLCEKLLCVCDQTAAECLASTFYNQSLKSPGRQECQGHRPSCEDGSISASSLGSSSEENSEEAPPPREGLRRTRRFLGKSLGLLGTRPQRGPR
eukprot:bmy_20614T0